MNIVEQRVFDLKVNPDFLQHIERMGRTCYQSADGITKDSAAKFVNMLIKNGHTSVLEHSMISFKVITDRGVTHELVRQRIGVAYSQESTRFVQYDDIAVILPIGIERGTGAFGAWYSAMCEAESQYIYLIKAGLKAQVARSVLPTCLKTEIGVTMNLRSFLHLMALRYHGVTGPPHPQIKDMAEQARNLMIAEIGEQVWL